MERISIKREEFYGLHLHNQTLSALLLIKGQFTWEKGRDNTSPYLQFKSLVERVKRTEGEDTH